MKHKIRIQYDFFTPRQLFISAVIRRCMEAALAHQAVSAACEVNVLVTGDRGIRAINLASREMDSATDVLSFPMFTLTPGAPPKDWTEFTDPETGLVPLGDMCISLERATEQAREFGHSVKREVGYLTIHSALHLLGYDHLDEGPQKKQMRAAEEAIAAALPGMQR